MRQVSASLLYVRAEGLMVATLCVEGDDLRPRLQRTHEYL